MPNFATVRAVRRARAEKLQPPEPSDRIKM